MLRNVHERSVPAPLSQVGPLLDRLGGPYDVLWPAASWPPMRLDRPVAAGAKGGHGPVRYRVTAHEPGRRVEFTFDPRTGLHGTHSFTAQAAGPDGTVLRHVMEGRLRGVTRLTWPLVVRWLHDAVLEELLDNAERAVGARPAQPARWSPWVRLLRRLGGIRGARSPEQTPSAATTAGARRSVVPGSPTRRPHDDEPA